MRKKGMFILYEAVYDNVRIRPLEQKDIEQLRIWRNDSSKTKFLRPIGMITPSKQLEWFEEYQKATDEIIFAIEEIKEFNQIVGSLSIYHINGETAEIGKIQIGEEKANGRGIGKKSMVMALKIGFEKMGLKKIVGSVNPQNIPAYKNDMKIGFKVVGSHVCSEGIEEEIQIDWESLIFANSYLGEIMIQEYRDSLSWGGNKKRKVYIVDAKRTAIGKFGGTLKKIGCGELGSLVIKDILEKNKISSSEIEEVIIGNVLSAGQGQGVARQVQLLAGIPVETCAYAVNMVCGSSMKAVMNGTEAILLGDAEVVIAGGVENMSQAPYLLPVTIRNGCRMGDIEVLDGMIWDSLTDAFTKEHMGMTAEYLAERYKITREEQDQYAFASYQKAVTASDKKEFEQEIVPILISEKGKEIQFSQDEYLNRETTLEKLKRLSPIFQKDGTVTAGNASGINDGAAMLLLAGETYIKEQKISPLGEIVAYAQKGTEPRYMGMGPVYAIQALVEKTKISYEQIGIFEINEAFAVQSLAVLKELARYFGVTEQELKEKTNLKGGGIALGHPIGASGARILVTLIHTMKQKRIAYGIASLCIGGGMGTAILVRNIEY